MNEMNNAETEALKSELARVQENIALLQRHSVYNINELTNREKDLLRDIEALNERRNNMKDEELDAIAKSGYIKKTCTFYHRAEEASITGDTVGDPLKDTSGPSLNILIKLSSILSVVFSPLFLKTSWFAPKNNATAAK